LFSKSIHNDVHCSYKFIQVVSIGYGERSRWPRRVIATADV
jgi:hypothetical protein